MSVYEPQFCSKGGCIAPSEEACKCCGFDKREHDRRMVLLRRFGFARREDGLRYLRVLPNPARKN